MDCPILSVLIFLPLIGIVPLLFLPKDNDKLLKSVALLITVVEFIASLPLVYRFKSDFAGMQFTEQATWIPSFGIGYRVGYEASADRPGVWRHLFRRHR